MTRITTTQKILYSFFAQVVILLVIYAGLSLLTALKFLPTDALALTLTYAQVNGFANMMLDLAILTGLMSSGIYIISAEDATYTIRNEPILIWLYRLWSGVILLAILAGVFSQMDGRYMLEMPLLLDLIAAVLLGIALALVVITSKTWTPFLIVWGVGMVIVMFCMLIGILSGADLMQERILHSMAVNLKINVGYIVGMIPIAFWLMTRWSNVRREWVDEGIYTVSGLLAIAGVLVSFAPLYPLGLPLWVGSTLIFAVPVFYAIFAAHSYRALSDRNMNVTLSAQWYAVAVLLLMAGIGFLGTITAIPGIQQWTQGTKLTEVQTTLTLFSILAIVLSFINRACAEIRGRNERVTGFMPLWLIAFGVAIGAITLGGAGVAQVYMERILSIGYLDVQRLLVPVYIIWIVSVIAVAIGIAIYGLGFRARRPEMTTEG